MDERLHEPLLTFSSASSDLPSCSSRRQAGSMRQGQPAAWPSHKDDMQPILCVQACCRHTIACAMTWHISPLHTSAFAGS